MTNHGQHADQPEFKVEDEIDLLFGRANPNPTREGCPTPDVLKALSRREFPIEDTGYDHLARCSPCFRQFRAFQQLDAAKRVATTRSRLWWVIGAIVAVISMALWLAIG